MGYLHTWQTPEHFAARERRVHEETYDCIGDDLPEHLRHEEEVVVVHPYEVSGAVDIHNAFGEGQIGLLVVGPVFVG
jgi:hypothetical protein